jgi:hypothetical protein
MEEVLHGAQAYCLNSLKRSVAGSSARRLNSLNKSFTELSVFYELDAPFQTIDGAPRIV